MANHNQVAHAWANQTGKHRKGYNMFYDGDTIYSHGSHFPIARIVRPGVVLFTSRSYSVSTARHKSYVRRAIDSDASVFTVQDVFAASASEHRENYKELIREAREYADGAKRAISRGGWMLRQASDTLSHARHYASEFGVKKVLKVHTISHIGVTGAEAEAIRQRVAAYEANAEVRNAARRAASVVKQMKQNLLDRDKIKQWLRGENIYPPHTARVYVRVKNDKVETSWGASVPLDDAKKLWAAMKRAHVAGPDWRDTVSGAMVGDFTLNRVTPNHAKIGCHLIPYRYALCAAKIAGIE